MENKNGEKHSQNYYYIIPADLIEGGVTTKAILYGLICSLTLKQQYCTASNQYLAKKLGLKSKSIISKYINELKDEGWINVTVFKRNQREILPLAIYTGGGIPTKQKGIPKKWKGDTNKVVGGDTNKVEHSSKSNSSKNSNSAKQSFATDDQKKKDDENTPMTLQQFKIWASKSTRPHIRWIGEWADTIYQYPNLKPAIDPNTTGQWKEFIKRHSKIAVVLTKTYTEKQIAAGFTKAMEASQDGVRFKITPETIIKYMT